MGKTTTELNILITVTNQAKEAVTQALSQLGSIKDVLDSMGSTGNNPQLESIKQVLDSLGRTTGILELEGVKKVLDAVQGTNAVPELNAVKQSLDALGKTEAAVELTAVKKALDNLNATSNESEAVVSGLDKVEDSSGAVVDALNKVNDGAGSTGESLDEVGGKVEDVAKKVKEGSDVVDGMSSSFDKLVGLLKLVTGGFLAFEAVRMVKDVADVAARTETLGIVLQTVGANAGYTSGKLTEADNSVRKLGITAEASRQSIAQLIQTGLSIDFAKPLARASQDLAVISGKNSSETFAQIVNNIQQLDTLGLRFMGIMIDRERVFAEAAQETGKAISGSLQKTVFANAVLAEAAKLTGLYEASLESAGKQLTSLPRYIDNFKNALGQGLQPVYLQLILGTQAVLKALTDFAEAFETPAVNADLFGSAVSNAESQMSPLANAVKRVSDSIVDMIRWIKENKEFIGGLITTILRLIEVMVLLSVVSKAAAIGTAIFTAYGTAMAVISAVGPLAAAAIALFGRAATIAGATVSIAWAPVLAPIVAVIAAIGVLTYAYNKLTGSTKESAKVADQSADEMVSGFKAALVEQERLMRASDKAQDSLRKARNNEAANPKDKSFQKTTEDAQRAADAATASLKKQSAALADLRERLANSTELKGRSDLLEQVKAADSASKDRVKSLIKEQEAQQALSDALKQAGEDYSNYLNGIDSKTEQKIDTLRQEIDNLGRAKNSDIESGLLASLQLAQKIASSIESDKGLNKLRNAVEELNGQASKFGLNFGKPIEGLMAQAESNLSAFKQNLSLGGQAAANDQKQIARQTAQLERERLQGVADDRKQSAARLAEVDKLFFDKGLKNLDDYYAARINAAQQALNDEQAVQVAFIKGEIDRKALETDAAKKIQIEKEIEQSKNKLARSADRTDAEVQKLQIARLNQRLQLEKEVQSIATTVNREQGNIEAAIRQEISAAYENEMSKVRQLGDVQAEVLVQRKFEIELNKRLADERLSHLTRELDLRSALLDMDESRISLDRQRGELTTLDSDEKLNDIIRARVILLEEEFDATLKLRDEAIADSRVTDANSKNTKLAQLQKEIIALVGTLKSVGDSIKASLTDSIASNFEAILTRTKSFKQGMLDIFKDLNSQILKSITKNLAEEFTQTLSNVGKSGEGKGPGLFDKVASMVTGKAYVESPEISKEREAAINKANLAAVAQEEKFAATAVTEQMLNAATLTSDFTRRTADAAEALVRRYEADAAKKEQAAAGGLGTVSKTQLVGTEVGEVGGRAAETLEEKQTVTLRKLMALGVSFENAAGIAANIQKESSFNPQAVGDGGKAFGLAQWHPERQEDFKKMFGFDIKKSTGDQQLEFLVSELKNKESATQAALNKAKSAEESGSAFSKKFERPLDPTGSVAAERGKLAGVIADKNSDLNPLKVEVVNTKPSSTAAPQAAVAPRTMEVPQYDAMGNATGGTETVALNDNRKGAGASGDWDRATPPTVAVKSTGGASGDWERTSAAVTQYTEATKKATEQAQAAAVVEKTVTIAKQAEVEQTKVATAVTSTDTEAIRVSTSNLTTLGDAALAAANALNGVATAKPGSKPADAPNAEAFVPRTTTEGNTDAGITASTRQSIASAEKTTDYNAFGVVQSFGPMLGAAAGGKVGGAGGSAIGTILGAIFQKMDTSKLTSAITGNVQKGFDSVKAEADGGGLGIGGFFSSFSNTISELFSSMSSSGSGGGLGGLFSSFASMFGGAATTGAASGAVSNVMFAEGGFVSGPGTGTSDSINARLSNGEYVMTAEKTSMFLPMLEAMRNGSLDGLLTGLMGSMKIDIPKGPNFAAGGFVQMGNDKAMGTQRQAPSVIMNIQTNDARSFNSSRDQVMSNYSNALKRVNRRNG